MSLAKELVKGGIKLLKNAKPAAKVAPKVPAKQTAGSKAAPAKAPPSVPRKQTDAEIAKMEQQKAVAAAEKARDERWTPEIEASLRPLYLPSTRQRKHKKAEAAKKATKARRIQTVKNIGKTAAKTAAKTVGPAAQSLLTSTASMGEFSKELFGRKDKPTKVNPQLRRGGKPMKGTK